MADRISRAGQASGPRIGYRQSAALLALFAHALAAGAFFLDVPSIDPSEGWTGQFLFLLCSSLASSLAMPYVKKRALVAILFGFQIFLLLVADYPEGPKAELSGIFVCVLLLSAIDNFRVSLPLVPLLSAAGVFLFRLRPVRAWAAFPSVPPLADSAVAGAIAAVFAYSCLVAKSWEAEARRQRERALGLDGSIASLLAANLDFQNYALESGERSTIAERKRLTRDIHDVVGYTLINLKMMLEAAMDRAGGGNKPLAELLATACAQAQGGLSETRRVLRTLRDMENARPEGVARIHKIVTSFSKATGIEVEVNYGNMPRTLGPLDSVISHIVQEGMTNAIKHGGATRIQIGFWIVRDRLHMKVSDNGVGATEWKPGIGLIGMRERLEPFGGELQAQGSEYGFSLVAEMPLPEALLAGAGS